MGVLRGCKPRKEVLKGDLSDAIFAADFGNVIGGTAPRVYGHAKTFFENTYPTQQLRAVTETVFGRLGEPKEAGAIVRLSTGFGGGKTHTLIALWHLAKNIGKPAMGTELLPAAGRPEKIAVVAIDAGKAGVPEFGKHRASKVHSLHGEVLFQLGGAKALKSLGKADHPEASPSESQIEAVFPKVPVLVLIDELVIYMAKLSERGQGNLLGFLSSLGSVVSKRSQAVLIVTDPAQQVAYAPEAAQLGAALQKAAARLDDVLDRKASDFDPIGSEGPRVIVKRLFERVNERDAQAASATYHQLYKRVAEEQQGLIPARATSPEYAQRIVDCYPFHPRLLETAEERLGAMPDFQKSRGVLRLFGRILRDVWDAKEDYELISAGEINWSSPRIQADLLQRLNRGNFRPAAQADIERHAGELDGGAGRGSHRRVASALLLESLPLQSNSGLDPAELTLAVLRPDDAGPEPSEALDRLLGVCWHTYPMPGGRGWQFRYEPNIIKQIEERLVKVSLEDAKSRLFAEVQGYFSGPIFKMAPWPESAKQVPESAALQLVLCEDEQRAKAVCAYADDTNPQEPMPRQFQNAIVAVTATRAALNEALSRAQRLTAAEQIEREHRTGEAGKLVREQLKAIKPELQKQFRLQACRAFNRVVLPGGTVHELEERFQVPEEQILQRAHGQACLRRFLEEKGFIYRAGDALDVSRFLKNVLPGATPQADSADVYTAKAVHERFLSAPGLRLIPDGAIVRQTVLGALDAGKVVVRLADGRAFDREGCVEGPEGARRRIGGKLPSLALDDSVLVTRAGSEAAKAWLKVDRKRGPGPPPPPPPPEPSVVRATTWEKAVEYAQVRPLLKLELTAHQPAAGRALAALAQPLGAESIALTVTVSGQLKTGGIANFQISDVSLTHPTKPLDIARTLYAALTEDGTYDATLALDFGAEGRTDLLDQLRALAEDAPEDVTPTATFGKPLGGSQ